MIFKSKEEWLAHEIRERILEHNLNAIAIWVGPTGSGKSYSMLRLSELVDPDFTLKHLVFSAEDFLDLVNDESLGRGRVLAWDEAGLGMPAREWSSILNRSVGYVLQSFRFRNIALFLTVPDSSFIDAQARTLFHYYFECVDIDRFNKMVVVKPFLTEHSGRFGKDYNKYPQVKLQTGSAKITEIRFSLASKNLRESYEDKRKRHMDAYYRNLRDSLALGGPEGDLPDWTWRALLDLRSRLTSDTELAGVIQRSREHTNRLLNKGRAALRRAA